MVGNWEQAGQGAEGSSRSPSASAGALRHRRRGTECCLHHSKIEQGAGESQGPRMRQRGLWRQRPARSHLCGDEARRVGPEETLAFFPVRKHLVALQVAGCDDRGEAA